MRRIVRGSAIVLALVAALSMSVPVLTGCSSTTVSEQPALTAAPASATPTAPEATSASAVPETASVEPTAAPPAAPKLKPGTIVVRGSGPTIFGPYTFKRGGYTFKFEQIVPDGQDFNETSLVISLESKPGEVNDPYQLLSNTSKMSGTNQVYVSGKLWIDVSFSGNDYVLTFTPKGK